MGRSKFENLSKESLQARKNKYQIALILLIVAAIGVFILGNEPEVLGALQPPDYVFRVLFVVSFTLAFMVFRDWRGVKKEIEGRNT